MTYIARLACAASLLALTAATPAAAEVICERDLGERAAIGLYFYTDSGGIDLDIGEFRAMSEQCVIMGDDTYHIDSTPTNLLFRSQTDAWNSFTAMKELVRIGVDTPEKLAALLEFTQQTGHLIERARELTVQKEAEHQLERPAIPQQ